MTSSIRLPAPTAIGLGRQTWSHSGGQFVLNETILFLAIAQMVVTASAQPWQSLQMPVELLLGFCIGLGLSNKRLLPSDIAILSLLALVSLVAMVGGESRFFLVNLKQNTLAALSVIYFSKISHKSNLILPVLIVTAALILMNRIDYRVSEYLAAFSSDSAFNLSRFGGVFMSAHFNAFFIAAALLHYGRRFHLFGLGGAVVYLTASKFVFAAYLANFVLTTFSGRIPHHLKPRLLAMALAFATILVPAAFLFPSFVLGLFEGVDQNSLTIILAQVLDPAYYGYLLNLFPADPWYVTESARFHFVFHDGYNEIGFFALAVQSGTLFGLFFLVKLIRHSPGYGAFILVSLLHNLFILAPIMIFMFTQLGRGLPSDKDSGDHA